MIKPFKYVNGYKNISLKKYIITTLKYFNKIYYLYI